MFIKNREKFIYDILKTIDKKKIDVISRIAKKINENYFSNIISLRGLIEVSNYCTNFCKYCGINSSNKNIERYKMSEGEIIDSISSTIKTFKYDTIVIQSGEDFQNINSEFITNIIFKIKKISNLKITLSLGERSENDLLMWKNAGADRYMIRFETSNLDLYKKIHFKSNCSKGLYNHPRIKFLKFLSKIGYEVGSGFLVGIPGQTFEDLIRDILIIDDLNLFMLGIGQYIPSPDTKMGRDFLEKKLFFDINQTPNTTDIIYRTLSIIRILYRNLNIVATTALSTVDSIKGYKSAINCGANVIMINITPHKYRKEYKIYPKNINNNDVNNEYIQIQLLLKSIGKII